MKKFISCLIAFSLFIIIFPVTINAKKSEQYYTDEQIENIVNKYESNEDMFNALFCEDSAVGYWALINDFKQNKALSWAVDMSSKLIGEYPEKQDYAEILANLIIMQSGGLAEQIENQSRFDDMKDIGDYALDVIGIASSFIGAGGALETISTAISTGVDGINDVIIKNNEQAKYYEVTLQDYSQANIFLSAIGKYAESEELRNVATALLEANETLFVKRLEYLADASKNMVQYESKFFVNNMSMELLKETDLYATDKTVKWFVDEGINLKNTVLSMIDAATFAFKMTMLAGDIGFGTSDVYNRYQEMKVVADIAGALVKANESVAVSNKDKQAQAESIREKCNYYKALLVTHARGEYLIYQLLMNDAGVLSDIRWLTEYFKNPQDTTDVWYESQIEILIKYYDILSKIFLDESNIGFSENTLLETYAKQFSYLCNDLNIYDIYACLEEDTGFVIQYDNVPNNPFAYDIDDFDNDGNEELLIAKFDWYTDDSLDYGHYGDVTRPYKSIYLEMYEIENGNVVKKATSDYKFEDNNWFYHISPVDDNGGSGNTILYKYLDKIPIIALEQHSLLPDAYGITFRAFKYNGKDFVNIGNSGLLGSDFDDTLQDIEKTYKNMGINVDAEQLVYGGKSVYDYVNSPTILGKSVSNMIVDYWSIVETVRDKPSLQYKVSDVKFSVN